MTDLTLASPHPVISRHPIEWFCYVGEFAVTSRKPTFLRWLEEAEAKQVCEWAEIEGACDQAEVCPELAPSSRIGPFFLRRLRGLFGNQTVQIARDDQRRDSLL